MNPAFSFALQIANGLPPDGLWLHGCMAAQAQAQGQELRKGLEKVASACFASFSSRLDSQAHHCRTQEGES